MTLKTTMMMHVASDISWAHTLRPATIMRALLILLAILPTARSIPQGPAPLRRPMRFNLRLPMLQFLHDESTPRRSSSLRSPTAHFTSFFRAVTGSHDASSESNSNDEHTSNSDQKRVLEDFLKDENDKPVQSYEPAADAAAKRLTALVTAGETPEVELRRLWDLIAQVAVDQPGVQPRLIRLLRKISDQPAPASDSKALVIYGRSRTWKDLPLLDEELRDRWEARGLGAIRRDGALKREQWADVNAFLARITANRLIDLKHIAIWTLRAALEERYPIRRTRLGKQGSAPSQPPKSKQRQQPPSSSTHPLDTLVPGAAEWILKAGLLIYRSEDDYGKIGTGGDRFEGKPGFSRSRWLFWLERFTTLQTEQGLNPKTKDKAKEAADEMRILPKRWRQQMKDRAREHREEMRRVAKPPDTRKAEDP